MNFFAKDTLAELDSSSRLFRAEAPDCMSPTKLRAKELFLSNPFLAKRESLDLDDFAQLLDNQPHTFLLRPLAVAKHASAADEGAETKANSQRVDDASPQSARQMQERADAKLKRTKLVESVQAKSQIIEPNLPVAVHKDFLSDVELAARGSDVEDHYTCEEPLKAESAPLPTEQFIVVSPTTDKIGQKSRKADAQPTDKLIKRKKTAPLYSERNQLRSRVAKVSAFWRGEHSFIPSVFRLVSLQTGARRCVIEFQDFSLKGLSHMADMCSDEMSESKLSRQIDNMGQVYFHEDGGL